MENLITRPIPIYDQATPSGNAMVSEVLVKLAIYCHGSGYDEKAAALFTALSSTMSKNSFGVPTLLNAYDLYLNAIEIRLIDAQDGRADYFKNLLWAHLPAHAVVQTISAPDHAASHIVICRHQRCSLPLQNEEDILHMLETLEP